MVSVLGIVSMIWGCVLHIWVLGPLRIMAYRPLEPREAQPRQWLLAMAQGRSSYQGPWEAPDKSRPVNIISEKSMGEPLLFVWLPDLQLMTK